MSQNPKSAGDTLTKESSKTKEPPLFKVILLNDDYTTMEFVISMLQNVFRKSQEEAQQIMMSVHQNGRGIAGIYVREIAETKIAIVQQLSRREEFPLKCIMEPE